MNLHEYQAKKLLSHYGITVPDGLLATTPHEAESAARQLGGRVLVKAQIHSGGRGKAGGAKLADHPQFAAEAAAAMLGTTLVTKQTGPKGLPVNMVLVERAEPIAQELYLGLLVDRQSGRLCFVGSAAGGMDIEEVAATTPERITTVMVHPAAGFQPYQGRRLAQAMGLPKSETGHFVRLAQSLYNCFVASDASLIEINPLALMHGGGIKALDAKVTIDDNALPRQKELEAHRDPTQEDPREHEAAEHGISYVALDGDIGCMVNGAGLAMATMDVIQLSGGKPANFLDVGGGATAERVSQAFRLICSDPGVKAILINIFGGIVRCDLIAEGIIKAAAGTGLTVPLVVRLQGTNMNEGRRKLDESGLAIISATTLPEAAEKVVAAARSTA